ncbi:MAG: TetR/AcrR family transcriptional regulator [Acidimicrobiaceae bacterium]
MDQGLDELSIGEVARLSGLTTGAIYGRYEDADEMAIELWQSVIRQPFKARLQRSVEFIVAGPNNLPSANRSKIVAEGALETITKDFESPDEIAKLGAEFLVISRRNQTVGEVVIPEVTNWFSEFGLVNTNDPIANATIVIGLSASIGTALRTFVLKANPSWMTIANALQDAATEATPVKIPNGSPPPNWVEPETENPVRSALIDAVAEVVAKTGFANATISRIVRRAGVTNGSLYNLYKDKEALTDDAMQIFLNLSSDVNRESNRRAATDLRLDRGLNDSFVMGLLPNRRMWLDFRLECLIASRNHLPTRRKFKQSLERSRDDLASTMPDLPIEVINLISSGEQAVGIGFTVLEPYTSLLRECDFYSIMAKLSEQNHLLQLS